MDFDGSFIKKIKLMASNKDLVLDYLAKDRKWASGVQLYYQVGISQNYKRQINSSRPTASNLRNLYLALARDVGIQEYKVQHILTLPLNHPNLENYKLKSEENVISVPQNGHYNHGGDMVLSKEQVAEHLKERKSLSLREEFKFLSSEECPDEFKILVSDLITDYHKYVKTHENLSNVSLDELYKEADATVTAYVNNKLAWEELEHYKLNAEILGLHPLFKYKEKTDKFKDMSLEDLVKKKQDIVKRSALRESQLELNDEPHLEKSRLEAKERDIHFLNIINKLLPDDGKH